MRQLKESLDKLDIENKSLVFEKNNALSTMNQQNLEMEALSSQLEALKILNSELEDENYNMRIKVTYITCVRLLLNFGDFNP